MSEAGLYRRLSITIFNSFSRSCRIISVPSCVACSVMFAQSVDFSNGTANYLVLKLKWQWRHGIHMATTRTYSRWNAQTLLSVSTNIIFLFDHMASRHRYSTGLSPLPRQFYYASGACIINVRMRLLRKMYVKNWDVKSRVTEQWLKDVLMIKVRDLVMTSHLKRSMQIGLIWLIWIF